MNIELYGVYTIIDNNHESKVTETLWLQEAKAAADQAQTQHPTSRVIVVRWNSATNRDTVVYEATPPQAEPVKAIIIADITKEIKYSRATRDYSCYVTIDQGEPQYIGSAANYSAGETICNAYAFDYLTDTQTIETAAELLMELPAAAFCATCGNDGDCPDCEPTRRYTRAAGYDRRVSHGNRESSDCWKDQDGIPHWVGVGIDPNEDDASDCEPSVAAQLAAKGLREAHGERGSFVNVRQDGAIRSVWACPVEKEAPSATRIRIPRGCEIVRQRDGFVMTAAHAMTVLATMDRESGCMLFAHPGRGLCYVMESWVAA